MINARLEHKTCGLTASGATTVAGAVSYLSAVAEDDTVNGRTGTVIRPTKLELKFRAYDAANINFVRVVIFRDTMNQGASSAVTDVLLAATPTSPYNYLNVEQSRRFKILYDHTAAITPSGIAGAVFDKTLVLKGNIHYIDTTDLVGSAGRNSLFALVLSSTAGATLVWSSRLIFTDA
jgi:hypothetical protein